MAYTTNSSNYTFCRTVDQLLKDYDADNAGKSNSGQVDQLIADILKAVDLLKPSGNLEAAWQEYNKSDDRVNDKDKSAHDHTVMNDVNRGLEANIPIFGQKSA